MQIKQGDILISTTVSGEDMFERSVVLIAEQNDAGYVGFIVNKPFPRKLNDLLEYRDVKALKLFTGGPVDTDHIFFIHRRPDLIDGGSQIIDDIYFSGNFSQTLDYFNDGILSEDDIKIFIGYCGWDLQQLEDELNENFWTIADIDQSIFFSENITNLWSRFYKPKK